MYKTILINSNDLNWHIDTYGMLDGESVCDNELDHYKDEYNLTDSELKNIDFDYDHKEIVNDFANKSIEILEDEFIPDGIVKSIELVKSSSPKFYNYTSDSYTANWAIDLNKLIEYISKDLEDFKRFLKESWTNLDYPKLRTVSDFANDDDDHIVAMLDYYTLNELTTDYYDERMWETETEVYCNNMTLTKQASEFLNIKGVN